MQTNSLKIEFSDYIKFGNLFLSKKIFATARFMTIQLFFANKKMKVTFIYPRFEKFLESVLKMEAESKFFTVGKFTCPPSLGIPILASLTPDDVEINFIDDNAGETLDFSDGADLYAINCFTPQGTRALEIARMIKAANRKVVMGGMFASFMPDECLEVADAVCIGEGEYIWPELIDDLKAGVLKRTYRARKFVDMSLMPAPRRDIFYDKKLYDWDEDLLQLTRGCPYNCAMCILPAHMGNRMRFKPVEKAVEEILGLRHKNIYLTDDSLFFPQKSVREYAEKFFDSVTGLGRKFFVSSTLALNSDEAFFKKAAAAGVRNFYCTLNVDPFSIDIMRGDNDKILKLAELVDMLKGLDISFFASFGLGRDWDCEGVSDRVLEICSRAKISMSEFFIFSPYPGSAHWRRLESQKRITSREWYKYNGAHVVFEPAKMSAARLKEEFINCWKGFYEMNQSKNLAKMEPSVWDGDNLKVSKRLELRGVEREAAVTGIGVISPLGCRCSEVVQALKEGRDGIGKATKIDLAPFVSHICAEAKNFEPSEYMDASELDTFTDPFIRMSICAARAAVKDAKVDINSYAGKVGYVIATCNSGLNSGETEYRKKFGEDVDFDRLVSTQSEFYSLQKAVVAAIGVGGECWMVNTACSGSTVAIGLAQTLIESGRCDVVLVGGADALALSNFAGFSAIKVVSPEKIAPFSTPEGMNIGEGAAFWVVENLGKALLRSAECKCKIIGHATTSDAHHPTQPEPRGDGVFRTLYNAAADAGINVSDLGCINAHGSGTSANDRAESKGIAKFLGTANVPTTSTKSYMGHCMGATGILEATSQILAMNEDFIPPTLRNKGRRAGCEIEAVSEIINKKYDCFISANYAFGGNNAAVVIAKRDFIVKKSKRDLRAKIAVTGLGLVSPFGTTMKENIAALQNGKCAISKMERFDSTHFGGLVSHLNPRTLDRRVDFSGMNNISVYATLSTKRAMDSAGLKLSRADLQTTGITAAISRGSCETPHMDAVFSNSQRKGDVGCFSNVTANSTAGWVSKALEIKGSNITLTPGPNGGLQAVGYSLDILRESRAKRVIAFAADELYAQQIDGYDKIGNLYSGDDEKSFKLRFEDNFKTVYGEGACALVLERSTDAKARGVEIFAEILSFASYEEIDNFTGANLGDKGLRVAVKKALDEAQIKASDIDLLVWSPRGDVQDEKILKLRREMFADTAIVTNVFNTGYVESVSTISTLACVLFSVKNSLPIWKQNTGVAEIDNFPIPQSPKKILALASSHIGNNFALVCECP